jgi:RND family efflux transporter MFP subunit
MRHRLFALTLCGLAASASGLACSRDAEPTVQVAEVRRAPLRVAVSTNGKVEPIDDIELRARLDGRVVSIPDPGARVEQGAPLLRIDAATVSAQLATARSERLAAQEALRAGRNDLLLAGQRFQTDRDLFRQGALTRQRFNESEAAQRDAQSRAASLGREVPLRLDSFDLRIRELEDQLRAAEAAAPLSGTVYRTDAKKGQMVRVGDPLLAVADLSRLRVRTNVDQVDLGRVKPGARVYVSSNAYPGRSWSGHVSDVVPHVVVKESRAVSESLAVLDPPTDGLVPGMTVDVEIVVAEAPEAVQVPADAVVSRGGETFVYKLDGSRVRATPVKIGLTSVTATEVLEGLAPGDVVVVIGAQGLVDGAHVDVRRADARAS